MICLTNEMQLLILRRAVEDAERDPVRLLFVQIENAAAQVGFDEPSACAIARQIVSDSILNGGRKWSCSNNRHRIVWLHMAVAMAEAGDLLP